MSGQQGGAKQVAQRKITKKGLFAKDCKYQPRPVSPWTETDTGPVMQWRR